MSKLEQFFKWKECTVDQFVFAEPEIGEYCALIKQRGSNEIETTVEILVGLLKDKKQEKEFRVVVAKMRPTWLLEFGKQILEELGLVQRVK